MEDVPTHSESEAQCHKTRLWIETGVVVLVCVLPPIFTSEADVNGLRSWPRPSPFLFHALNSLAQDVGQIALVLFIIWRSNDPLRRFGLVPFKIGKDLIGALLLCALLRGMYHLLWWSLRTFLSRADFLALIHTQRAELYIPPAGFREYLLLAITCLFSGFLQELVMRAFLIVRLEELVQSTFVAALLSTVLFIGYHGYQGLAGVVGVALFGVIQAVVFCIFRRLAPISLAHSINNFIAIGRLPWI